MSYMFYNGSVFDQDISLWNVSSVASMQAMFRLAPAFNQDIGGWDVSNVTDMQLMFLDAAAFNQDLAGWCVINIPTTPPSFDQNAISWVLPRPVWGTCPP